ncbi:MAG: two-component regulator propeller domain-containing protein [Acidobacteriota bacterium]|nr:two-component regulator propeller domain-containing protein [Acidobacteriota bacterium]
MRVLALPKWLCLFWSGWVLFGQTPNLHFESLSSADRTTPNTVRSIIQDRRGFMWIGTEEGLFKYDGYEFTRYKTDFTKPSSLPNDYIYKIVEDSEGKLWISTKYGGLIHFDPDTENSRQYAHDPDDPAGLIDNRVPVVFLDSSGNVWAGTDSGLDELVPESNTFNHYLHDSDRSGSARNRIRAIFEDRVGVLWIGTRENGLSGFDREKGTFTHFRYRRGDPDSLPSNYVPAILEDHLGELWVGTEKGLGRLNRETGIFRAVGYRLGNNEIKALCEDRRGRLWVGSYDGTISRYIRETDTFISYRDEGAEIDNLGLTSLYEDHSGMLWAGSKYGGLSKVKAGNLPFRQISQGEDRAAGPTGDHVTAICEGRDGVLWIATKSGGLSRLGLDGTFTHFQHRPDDPNSLSENQLTSLHEDGNGNLWIGTNEMGLNRLNAGERRIERISYHPANPEKGLYDKHVKFVHGDRDGVLWVGTRHAVHRHNREDNSFTAYISQEKTRGRASYDSLRTISEDSDGVFWIGKDSGLALFDSKRGRWAAYTTPAYPEGLPIKGVLTLYRDGYGLLWVGTRNGLYRLDRRTEALTGYNEEDGLSSNQIAGILQDDQENLWISTFKGISKYHRESETFINYSTEQGLLNRQLEVGAIARRSNGDMLFGGLLGIDVFRPEEIEEDISIPPIAFTAFKKFGARQRLAPYLELSHRDRFLEFEFSVLDFKNPAKNQYAYQMEGFDPEWIYSGSDRRAVFTNLDPGNYTLRVKGTNSRGIWSEEAPSIRIRIRPPFWQTWWFRVFAATALVSLIISVHWMITVPIRNRNQALKEVNVRLNQQITAREQAEEKTQQLNRELEERVQQRTAELESAHEELLEKAHQEGMAQIATSVLHNVGNVLNSVLTSGHLIQRSLEMSKLDVLLRAFKLSIDHLDPIFLATDPKGKKLVSFAATLEQRMLKENRAIGDNTQRLMTKIESIRDIVMAQQKYASYDFATEELSLQEVVEDALKIQDLALFRHNIQVEKLFQSVPKVLGKKSSLVHVIINLLKNAKESIEENGSEQKKLTILINKDESHTYLKVADSGLGIEPENLEKIFSYGFTTKKNGHGFGLHSCANAVTEMRGSMWAESKGLGKGATLCLKFPITGSE